MLTIYTTSTSTAEPATGDDRIFCQYCGGYCEEKYYNFVLECCDRCEDDFTVCIECGTVVAIEDILHDGACVDCCAADRMLA